MLKTLLTSKRTIGAVIGIIALALGYFGFNISGELNADIESAIYKVVEALSFAWVVITKILDSKKDA